MKILGKIKGFNWCSFEWNSIAEKLGLKGWTCGIMADEVFEKVPEAVILKDGFMWVLYQVLLPQWQRSTTQGTETAFMFIPQIHLRHCRD